MSNVERSGLIRTAGHRTGVPGRGARLYEIRPDAGFVLGLDIGQQYLRGALADLSGEVRARRSERSRASSVSSRIAELVGLSDGLCAEAGVARAAITQTVIGSPGVYNPRLGKLTITGGLSGWGKAAVLGGLRDAFGPDLVVENDADAPPWPSGRWARPRRGQLRVRHRRYRHRHGLGAETAGCTAASTGWPAKSPTCPSPRAPAPDEGDARRRGVLEAAGSAAGVVRPPAGPAAWPGVRPTGVRRCGGR